MLMLEINLDDNYLNVSVVSDILILYY